MKNLKIPGDFRGQALVEIILALPILLLFVAGISQLAVTFLCYVQFEHACGEAARQYAAGTINKDALGSRIANNLGNLSGYFDIGSLDIRIQTPSNNAEKALDKVRHSISYFPFVPHYEGYEWSISIKVHPPFLFKLIFPNGITFRTVMQVYRYPT